MTAMGWIFLAIALLVLPPIAARVFFGRRRPGEGDAPCSSATWARYDDSGVAVQSSAGKRKRPRSQSTFSAVDDALARMQVANIAFNSPSPINLDESAKVELHLDLHLPPAKLVKTINARGEVSYAKIKVSSRMTAHLSGYEFDIMANTPETQAISGREPTKWMWTVKPKTAGQCDLCLDLSAIIDVDGSRTERTIKTFSKTIHVTVTPGQRVKRFAKEHWKWLGGTILIPLAGWLWKLHH